MRARRPWREAPIDDARLERALALAVEPAPGTDWQDGTYRVRSGAEAYWVALWGQDDAPVCDCADHTYQGVLCQHALAALVYVWDKRVLEHLARMTRRYAVEGRLVYKILRAPPVTALR